MMSIENKSALLRFSCLLCSLGTLWCYSYLVGGTAGYLFGEGRPVAAALGFVGGTILAFVALKLWSAYLKTLKAISEEKEKTRES